MTHDTTGPQTWQQVFRREGEIWTLEFGGAYCRMRDTTGLRYLAHLLRQPHCMVPAIAIVRGHAEQMATEESADAAAVRERARVNVTRAISAALKRIDEHHPRLAAHLRATIRTGNQCTYTPDPRLPLSWEM